MNSSPPMALCFGSTVSLENSLSSSTNGFFGPAVAFLGGFISFLSPCVLPIAPVCLASLTGEVLTPGVRPRGLMLHATFFVLGFTIVFTVLGSAAGLLSSVLLDNLEWLTRIGGLFVIALGFTDERPGPAALSGKDLSMDRIVDTYSRVWDAQGG